MGTNTNNSKKTGTGFSLKLKNRLLNEMESYFEKDKNRIVHTREVVKLAEELLKKERGNGVNKLVVIAAAVLHDIGVHACEKKYNSTEARFQEKEGPPIARHIMSRLDFEEDIIDEVCQIIANHHGSRKLDSPNFKILYDAERLARGGIKDG